MGLFEKDYLIRLLEQLSEMAAAITAMLAGGRARDALTEVSRARSLLAGPLAGSLDRLDAASVASLLGPEKARALVDLARLEARARAALGEDAAARAAEARADQIARALGPG